MGKNAVRTHVSTNLCIHLSIHPEIILKIKLDNYQFGKLQIIIMLLNLTLQNNLKAVILIRALVIRPH